MTAVDKQDVREAARLIREGGLVAFPTETVYGLGANALDAAAVERIFKAKGRPATSPLIVHVDSVENARNLVLRWPAEAATLAEKFWPGPLTLVLEKTPRIPNIVTAGLPTVGVRVPDHPLALALIREAGVPIAAPSANLFTELSATSAGHVRPELRAQVDFVLDGGATPVGIESTVLSLAGGRPLLLRPGMISLEDLEERIGPIAVAGEASGAHPAPGMHHQHYSPRTRLLLLSGADSSPEGRGVFLRLARTVEAVRVIQMPRDPATYAARLYGILHELDAEDWDWIAVDCPPDSQDWAGIQDRLSRAAHRV
jgi:L-threonylcarbamoyladenylate synthase